MPGLSIVHDASGRPDRLEAAIERLRLAQHFPDYHREVLFRSNHLLVAATRYGQYPLATFQIGELRVCIEGRLYGETAPRLEHLADTVARHVRSGPAGIPGWQRLLAGVDGDFVAAVVDPRAETVVVGGDRYGRLPVYHAAQDGLVVASRELRYVARSLPGAHLSRRAAAEHLLLGYPLGSRTLIEGVERLPPGATLHVPARTVTTMPAHDFDQTGPLPVAERDLPAYLAERVIAACRARAASGRRCVVSLSGGIDSRLVAGALRQAGVDAVAASHRGNDAITQEDAHVAGVVAARLRMPWEAIAVAPPTGADVERLLHLKGGANHLGLSRMVPYLDDLLARHGRDTVLFTGDQGDRLLGNRRPLVPLRDDDELAAYLVRRESLIAPDVVARLCGIARDDLLHAVHERLRTYPERVGAHRHVHFLFYERALRFVAEGEDRNRCWFWHASPFWAPTVFETGVRIPAAAKAHDSLRAAVLHAVAPGVADVPTARSKSAPASARYQARRRLEARARALMLRTLGEDRERRLKRLVGRTRGSDPESAVVRCVRRQLPAAGGALDGDGFERVVGDLPREQALLVLTVTAVGEMLGAHPSTLQEFRSERFG